jgi:HD-like signal output (HDOD) protein
MRLDPQQLIDHSNALVSLPDVALLVTRLVDNPHSSVVNIGRVIEQDPGLTDRLLRILNSPYYGFPSTIDTIARAITVIGIRDLRDLILAAGAAGAFERLTSELAEPEAFWHHGLYCAVIARILAEHRREQQPERFFLAGLLHDVGTLLLSSAVPSLARQCQERVGDHGENPHHVERELFGVTHAEVGCALAERWHLPQSLSETIRCHHAPHGAGRYTVEAAVIHIADFAADCSDVLGSRPLSDAAPDPEAWELTGITPRGLESIIEGADKRFAEMQRLLFDGQEAA